jgi:hypothetical protein
MATSQRRRKKVSKIEQCFPGRACNQDAKPEAEKNINMILIPAAT